MGPTTGIASASLPRARRRPLRLSVFVFFSVLDLLIVVVAVLSILAVFGLPRILGPGAFVEIWGSRYTLGPPTFPWVVGAVGALSVVAAWFAYDGRRFAFVLAVALGWVALGLAAIAAGFGEGLLVQRTICALLLLTCRSWFRS